MSRSNHLLILPALGAMTALAACTNADAARTGQAERAIPVRVATAESGAVALPVTGTGTLAARDELTLSFKIGGVVRQIAVDPGDRVRAGQTLAVLDLDEIDAAVAQATAARDKAERDLARAERLHADSVVPLVQVQDARTAVDVARAGLSRAQVDRRYAVIRAPSSGVILRRSAEPGELVSPGAPVLVVASSARGSVVRLGVVDRDALRVRPGDPAEVEFDALPDETFTGTVTEVGAAPEPSTGTYLVEITVARGGGLVTGMIGRVRIMPSAHRSATLVPVSALLEAEGTAATIFVLRADGRVERRPVRLGALHGERIAVDGVRAGERVITDGAAYVDHESPVEVVR